MFRAKKDNDELNLEFSFKVWEILIFVLVVGLAIFWINK